MVGSLLPGEEVGAALRLALSGAVVALVANGLGPVSLARMVSGTPGMDIGR